MISKTDNFKHPSIINLVKMCYSQKTLYCIEELFSLSLHHLKVHEKRTLSVASIEKLLSYVTKQVTNIGNIRCCLCEIK